MAEEEKLITIKGKAYRSKAGLVVEGTMIMDYALPQDPDYYAGKTVEVTGVMTENPHPTHTKEGLPQQGFEGNAMTKVTSIKIVEE